MQKHWLPCKTLDFHAKPCIFIIIMQILWFSCKTIHFHVFIVFPMIFIYNHGFSMFFYFFLKTYKNIINLTNSLKSHPSVRVRCEYGASTVRVRCEYGARTVRVRTNTLFFNANHKFVYSLTKYVENIYKSLKTSVFIVLFTKHIKNIHLYTFVNIFYELYWKTFIW